MKKKIKDSATGRWGEILTALGGLSQEHLSGKHGPCPRCGGKDRFRTLDINEGALFCNQCFSEKNGDGLAALQWLKDWEFNEAVKAVADFLGIEYKPGKKKSRKRGEFEWLLWKDMLCLAWIMKKPGATVEAFRENGGLYARWKEYTVGYPGRFVTNPETALRSNLHHPLLKYSSLPVPW